MNYLAFSDGKPTHLDAERQEYLRNAVQNFRKLPN